MLWLRRRWHGRRACTSRSCPHRQLDNYRTVWCRDHTDAITAGGPGDEDGEIERRLGARRWLLLAEVELERERAHVPVIEQILAMPPERQAVERHVWGTSFGLPVTLPMGPHTIPERIERLRELGLTSPLPRCPHGSWSAVRSTRCRLDMGHRGDHDLEVLFDHLTETRGEA